MLESILEGEDSVDLTTSQRSHRLVEFILARAAAQKLSVRAIGDLCGIKRGRCGAILHKSRDKRLPFRIDEIEAIMLTVKIDQIEASLAMDMMTCRPEMDEEAAHRVVQLMTEFVRGLPSRVADIVDHMDGLDYDDLKREQGRWLQGAVCDFIQNQFADVVKRRDFRLRKNDDWASNDRENGTI